MEYKEYLLFIIPIITLVYSLGEYWKWWDYITSRAKAIDGYKRLKSAEGFPKTWIYKDKKEDYKIFNALLKRISKRTNNKNIISLKAQKITPTLITIGGVPIIIEGLEPNMKNSVYADIHPVLFIYGVHSSDQHSKGKAAEACNLGDLEKWIEDEKVARRYWIITIIVGLLSLILIYIRIKY